MTKNYEDAVYRLTNNIAQLSIKQFDDTAGNKFVKQTIKLFKLQEDEATKLKQYFYVIHDLRVEMRNKFFEHVDSILTEVFGKSTNIEHGKYCYFEAVINTMYNARRDFYSKILRNGSKAILKDIKTKIRPQMSFEHSSSTRIYTHTCDEYCEDLLKSLFYCYEGYLHEIKRAMITELTSEQYESDEQ